MIHLRNAEISQLIFMDVVDTNGFVVPAVSPVESGTLVTENKEPCWRED